MDDSDWTTSDDDDLPVLPSRQNLTEPKQSIPKSRLERSPEVDEEESDDSGGKLAT